MDIPSQAVLDNQIVIMNALLDILLATQHSDKVIVRKLDERITFTQAVVRNTV